MKTYTNKTVLITGASSGIGMAMAHDLCGRGANLILVARSTEKLNGLAELIRKKGIYSKLQVSVVGVINVV